MDKFDKMLGVLHELHGEEFTQLIALDMQCDCLTRAWVVGEISQCQRSKITQHAVMHSPLQSTPVQCNKDCASCQGRGEFSNGEKCQACAGNGHCSSCAGTGQVDVVARIGSIDVRDCKAFRDQDKLDILAKIQNFDEYNETVRQTIVDLRRDDFNKIMEQRTTEKAELAAVLAQLDGELAAELAAKLAVADDTEATALAAQVAAINKAVDKADGVARPPEEQYWDAMLYDQRVSDIKQQIRTLDQLRGMQCPDDEAATDQERAELKQELRRLLRSRMNGRFAPTLGHELINSIAFMLLQHWNETSPCATNAMPWSELRLKTMKTVHRAKSNAAIEVSLLP